MDYINFGIGTGATLALFGWLFRDWGPRIRDHAPLPDEVLSARELVSRMAWVRFCRSCGMALTIGGLLVVFATVGVAIWNPEDSLGFDVVLGMYAAVIVLMMIWAAVFLRQFGGIGIIRPRVKTSLSSTTDKPVTAVPQGAPAAVVAAEATANEAPVDDKSFEEVAAGRGGLGRFAAFFRRDEPSQAPDTTSPTDAVIAELGTSGGSESDEKRLSINDPLVVRVVGWIDPDREVEAPESTDLQSELAGPAEEGESDAEDAWSNVAPEEPAASDTEIAAEATAASDTWRVINDAPSSAPATPEDEALVALRKRRLARLSGPSGDDS